MDKIYCGLYDKHHLKKYKSYNGKSEHIYNYETMLKIANSMNYKYVSEALIDLHTNNVLNPQELSEIFGMSYMIITKHLKKMNCFRSQEFRYASEKHKIAIGLGYKNIHDCVVNEYKKTKSAELTSQILQTTAPVILGYLRKHNIKINPPGGANNFKKPNTKQI